MAAYAKELGTLSRILELFMAQEKRVADRDAFDISAARCLVFTTIAGTPGIAARDIEKKLGLAPNVVSRHVLALSEWERAGRPGMNLVEARIDPQDTRKKLLFLTPTGRDFAERLIGTVSGQGDVRLDTHGADAMVKERWAAAAGASKRP